MLFQGHVLDEMLDELGQRFAQWAPRAAQHPPAPPATPLTPPAPAPLTAAAPATPRPDPRLATWWRDDSRAGG